MLGNRVRHSPVIASPWGRGRSRSSQEVSLGVRVPTRRVHGQAQTQLKLKLKPATMSLRQGLGALGPHGQQVWGLQGRLGRASKVYGWHVLDLLCLNTFLFGDSWSRRCHWQRKSN